MCRQDCKKVAKQPPWLLEFEIRLKEYKGFHKFPITGYTVWQCPRQCETLTSKFNSITKKNKKNKSFFFLFLSIFKELTCCFFQASFHKSSQFPPFSCVLHSCSLAFLFFFFKPMKGFISLKSCLHDWWNSVRPVRHILGKTIFITIYANLSRRHSFFMFMLPSTTLCPYNLLEPDLEFKETKENRTYLKTM